MSSKFCVLFIFVTCGATWAAEQNRYNVLLIAVDDLRPELGCYGVKQAQSPHLDAFAKTAVVFDRHYVQVATCGASRYALLTGRSPSASGVTRKNDAAYAGSSAFAQTQQPGAQTLPELFRRSGYTTSCVGKISHTPDGRVFAYNGNGDGRDELPHAWDRKPTPFGKWGRGWGIFFAYPDGRHREDGSGIADLMDFTVKDDNDLPDGLLAETAGAELQKFAQSAEPFFLGVGFFKPHLPFVAPKQDWEAFDNVELSLDDNEKPKSKHWHKSEEFYRYDMPFEKTNPLDEQSARLAKRAYYACVRYVDRQIGRVLSTLDQTGLADKTVVVVWGDHGWHLGEQQVWGKHTPFERANRSVLMIRVPGQTVSDHISSALVETTDIYPTLMDACNPEFQQTEFSLTGSSLMPILTGQQQLIRDTATSFWNNTVSVCDDRFRLVATYLPKQKMYRIDGLYEVELPVSLMRDVQEKFPAVVMKLQAALPEQP